MSYEQFFERVTGFTPFPYQVKFGQAEPKNGKLLIPTGGAKTLTVLVRWLWRHSQKLPVATRLVVAEPMRVLVGQIFDECQRAVENSRLDVSVHRLMGGEIDNSWINYPERPAIIIGTQDQILSRCLMRGYASSRWSWPKHFALLHNDCEYFIDETQLMGPGYSTSAWLAAHRKQQETFGSVSVTWASATLDPKPLEQAALDLQEWQLEPDDYAHPILGGRIRRLKRLHPAQTVLGNDLDTFSRQLAAEVLASYEANTLSLVILSQVDRAIALFQQIKDKGIPVRLLHSRFRRGDRAQLTAGLLDFRGILISTQVVEAGVDLSARRLYTDLCGWASFVQRAGRCGRHEKSYPAVDIYWIKSAQLTEWNCLPYAIKACEHTADTLQQLSDASIITLLAVVPPDQLTSGPVLGEDNLRELFDTHPMGSGDLDIQPFIREKSDRNCAVAWFAGDFPLSTWQPTENELCPVPTGKLQQFEGFVWNEFEEVWVATKGSNLRLGQIFALPASAGGYNAITGWTGDPTDKPTLLERTGIRDHYSDDRNTQSYMPVSLSQHSLDVRQEMQQLMNELNFELPEELLDIAQWHDLGKAHWVFQSALGSPKPIGAKGKFKKCYERCGFRHELASALAALHHNKPFYFAYLVAAHHGKVRGTITPLSYEETTYRGIQPGESLPEIDLGGGMIISTSQLNMPSGDPIKWWKDEVRALVKGLGVFRLAYLEAIVRSADARASIQ